ncbi:MAG: membrane protein insertase YidC [Bacteroidales bacterium]|nr:membrane protein insertase YidC [Bacteroidales bacterium]
MDKNTLIGIILIVGLFIGYYIISQPSKEELARQKHINDSIALVQQTKELENISKSKVTSPQIINPDSQSTAVISENSNTVIKDIKRDTLIKDKYGVFFGAVKGKNKIITLENENIILSISSKGGRISGVQLKEYKTYKAQPLILFDDSTSETGFNFFAENRNISTKDLYFSVHSPQTSIKGSLSSDSSHLFVKGNDSSSVILRLYTYNGDTTINTNKYIEFVYTLKGSGYMADYKINFVGMNEILSSNTDFINLSWKTKLKRMEKSLENEKNGTTIYYKYAADDVDYMSETKDGKLSLKNQIKWISFKQQFFTTVIVAENNFINADLDITSDKKSDKILKSMSAEIGIPFSPVNTKSLDFKCYFGPNKYKILKKYNLDLERQIPLGWSFFLMAWINKYAVIPVFNFLEGFNINYGIIILILTILLKIVLFPIAYKTYISSAKMKLLKPEIDEISKKYPKKEDMLKKQQATMTLYKKAGVSPMSGCIPMLLQFPILIALFRFFPASIELRQQSFLWADDLSSYDSILNLPFNIPFYGDHVSLFTLLMTASTIIYTMINNQMMAGTSQQMPGMKTMMYIMPVMFLGIFNNFSSGLSYYYFLANIFTFIQMYAIKQFVDEDKLHKQIQDNKKKPDKKKSGFQKRLEELAKQRGYKK